MPQPTLDERFGEGAPTRSAQDVHAWLNAEQERFIVWALKEHWSAARIGRALGVNKATVRRFRTRFWQEPRLLLELGLYEMAGRTREDVFRCLVCGDRVKGRHDMDRHILAHFLDSEVVDSAMSTRRDQHE